MNAQVIKAKVSQLLQQVNQSFLGLYELRLEKQELTLYNIKDSGVVSKDDEPIMSSVREQLVFEGSLKAMFYLLSGMKIMMQVGNLCSQKMQAIKNTGKAPKS